METPKIKPVKERDNIDLLNLALQLHTRSAIVHTSKEVHEASIEAKAELINRFNDLEQRNRELVEALKECFEDRNDILGSNYCNAELEDRDVTKKIGLILSKHSADNNK